MRSPSRVPGDCFAKCKHVPFYMVDKVRQARVHWSCEYARALPGCDKGGKPAYIDWETNDWRTCTCTRKWSNGSCYLSGWKAQ